MRKIKVQSSMIESIEHNDNTLRVEFTSGSVYDYDGVDDKMLLEFLKAPSLGSYFHEHIKCLPNRRVR